MATSPYNLIDNVDVSEGARLTIENGITVNGHKSVYVDGIRGTISPLNSVTFNGDVHVVNIGDYSIKNCVFTGDIILRQCNGAIVNDTVVNEGSIRIQESHNCKLTYNTGGIELWDSDHNDISNNNCSHTATGFGISCHSGSNNNSISNNVCSYNEIEGGVNVGIIIHSHSHYNEISNNICSHNGYDGIHLMFANNNKLTNNTLDFNGDYGIMVSVSDNNDIDKNRIVDNYNVGIGLTSGSKGTKGNTIGGEGNVIAGNKKNGVVIKGEGTDDNLLINNFIGTNTEATEKLSNEGNGVSISAGAKSNRLEENQISWNKLNGVVLEGEGTNGNIIGSNNEITNNEGNGTCAIGCDVIIEGSGTEIHDNGGWGIQAQSGEVDICDAKITNNGKGGIQLLSSSHGTLTGNTVSNNGGYGIYLTSCSDNTIYNNIFDNPKNAIDDGTNTWNIAKTKGTNIVGGPYLGGNYWSDYDGIDTNGDGLGDTLLPYTSSGSITNGGDYHPLIGSCYTETDTDGDCVDDTVDKCVGIQDATDTCGLPDDCLGYEYCCWTHNFVVEECSPGCELPEHDDCGSGVYLVSKTCVKEGVTCSDDIYEYWNDPDDDDDGWCDELCPTCTCCEGVDNCPDIYNPNQADTDSDGWGDLCDPYPDTPNKVDTATGMGPAIFASDTGELKKLKAIDEATLPDEGKQALVFSKPTLVFPYGFFSFNIIGLTPGQTVVVTITLPDNVPVGTEYWKYHAAEGGWIQIPMDSDDGDNVITITLVDGGLGDDDGTVNGVIVDQGGPGIPGAPPVITSFAPPSPVNDTVCNWRRFNVTVNQTVNVSWYLNNTLLHTNVSTKEASYTLHAEVEGEHNVSAIASNENGTDMQTWVWNVTAAPLPVLEINKTGVPDPVSPGGTLNYSISVNNTGNATATNVTVMETYDKNVTFVTAVPAPSSGDDTWQFATLNVSETRWINISVTVNASVLNGTLLHNIVNVSCAEGVTDSDTENTTVFLAPVPVLEITKTDAPDPVSPGGTLNYTISVNNTGNATATNVTAMETYDKNVTFVAAVPAPSSGDDTWIFSTLNVSETRWINISVTVNVSVPNGTVLHNIVNVSCDEGVTDTDTENTTVFVAPVPVLEITKTDAPDPVSPGGTITYTILYANVGPVALTNVSITENYPEGVTFISADPAPDAGTNNKWTIGTLPAGASGQIIIKVKVPESRDLTFTETGSVTGEGFVMVSKDLSTEQKPYRLKNVVTISCVETDPVTASASTTVSGVPGTSLEITEHGSGIYDSEEILNFGTKNKSIRLQKSTEAEYRPTSFYFSDGFSVDFTTRWMQDICSKNMVLKDAMHKKIKDATYIKDETRTETGEYGTELEFVSSFQGAAHIGAVSKDVTSSEDYIGEFEIFWAAKEECQYLFNWSRVPGNDSEKLIRFLVDNPDINLYWAENATITKSDDDRIINISTDWHSAEVILAANNESATVKVGNEIIYVLDVRTEDGSLNVYDCRLRKIAESVAGEGYVMVDKELTSAHIQVVEHGSGIYSSDMDFNSQRLNKSTEAEYQPTTFNFSDGFGVNFSSNWMQGICSKDKKAGTAIHKKISDAVSIADDTTATKSSMAFETSFNGSIHIGARATGTQISEDYIGVFNITEKIEIGKVVNASTATPVPDWLPCPFPEP